jgi:hypothetical protein
MCVDEELAGTARADSRRSGVGLAPGPQALPVAAAALVLYYMVYFYKDASLVRLGTCFNQKCSGV